MLWLKAFHIIFVVTWFAGLFYLPRLFVYHAGARDGAQPAALGGAQAAALAGAQAAALAGAQGVLTERFAVMERRLFGIMTIGGALTIALGIAMVAAVPAYLSFGWLHVKLALVALLVVYHIWCHRLMVALREGRDAHSQRWYRYFNEVPGLLLVGIVILAVVKPF